MCVVSDWTDVLFFFSFSNQWVTGYSLAGLLGAAFAHSFGDLSPWWRWRLSKVQDEEQQLPLFCVVPSHRLNFLFFAAVVSRCFCAVWLLLSAHLP